DIHVWDAHSGRELAPIKREHDPHCFAQMSQAPDGTLWWLVRDQAKVRVEDLETGQNRTTVLCNNAFPQVVDGHLLLNDGQIKIFSLGGRSPSEIQRFRSKNLNYVALAAKAPIAAVANDFTIAIWKESAVKHVGFPHHQYVSPALSSDGRWLAAQAFVR